jgi:hypothetical protein
LYLNSVWSWPVFLLTIFLFALVMPTEIGGLVSECSRSPRNSVGRRRRAVPLPLLCLPFQTVLISTFAFSSCVWTAVLCPHLYLLCLCTNICVPMSLYQYLCTNVFCTTRVSVPSHWCLVPKITPFLLPPTVPTLLTG